MALFPRPPRPRTQPAQDQRWGRAAANRATATLAVCQTILYLEDQAGAAVVVMDLVAPPGQSALTLRTMTAGPSVFESTTSRVELPTLSPAEVAAAVPSVIAFLEAASGKKRETKRAQSRAASRRRVSRPSKRISRKLR